MPTTSLTTEDTADENKDETVASTKCFQKWIDKLQDAVLYYIKELTHLEDLCASEATIECIQDILLHYLKLLARANLSRKKTSTNDQQDAMINLLTELRFAEKNLVPNPTMKKLKHIVLGHINALSSIEDVSTSNTEAADLQNAVLYYIDQLDKVEHNYFLQRTQKPFQIKKLKDLALHNLTELNSNRRHGAKRPCSSTITVESTTESELNSQEGDCHKNKRFCKSPCKLDLVKDIKRSKHLH